MTQLSQLIVQLIFVLSLRFSVFQFEKYKQDNNTTAADRKLKKQQRRRRRRPAAVDLPSARGDIKSPSTDLCLYVFIRRRAAGRRQAEGESFRSVTGQTDDNGGSYNVHTVETHCKM